VTSSPSASWTVDPQRPRCHRATFTFSVLLRRSGASLRGFKVEVADEAADAITRASVTATVERLGALAEERLRTSISIDTGCGQYLAVPDEHLQRSPFARRSSAETSSQGSASVTSGAPSGVIAIEADPQVRGTTRDAPGSRCCPAPSLRRFPFQFYAAVVGSDPRNRVAFVRKKNPASVVKPGHLLFAYGDRLTRVTEPTVASRRSFRLDHPRRRYRRSQPIGRSTFCSETVTHSLSATPCMQRRSALSTERVSLRR